MADIPLMGCAPIPLAAYLKALGIFRLVAEQSDRRAHGFWRDEHFVLDAALSEDELVRFFLHDYSPSPIIAPWNGGSGFYYRERKSKEKDPETGKKIKTGIRDEATAATRIVDRFGETTSNARLAPYRRVIADARTALDQLSLDQAPSDAGKQALVRNLRARLPDESLAWLDAAVALTSEDLRFPPLLGSGGNDGNLDFSANFMMRLSDLIDPETGRARDDAEPALRNALFASPTTTLGKGAVGQFAPGAAGGPNATAGFESKARLNPWDYVLMLEGALMFAASATRRLHSSDGGALSYPFTVRPTSAAGAGAALSEEGDMRGEIWVPLWTQSAAFPEIAALMSEGRTTLGRKPAREGLDFARAIATLGVNRGVNAFQRFGFMQRAGKAYVAAPMSRVLVTGNSQADLVTDLDRGDWLQRFRRHARAGEAAAGLRQIGRALDEAIFALTQDTTSHQAQAVQKVLIAVGEAAAYLATSPKARDEHLNPPPRLRRDWFTAAADSSPEFRIAAALAGLGWAGRRDAHVEGDAGPPEGVEERGGEPDAPPDDMAGSTDAPTTAEMHARRGGGRPPPFCAHLAPLAEWTWHARQPDWGDGERLTAWGVGTLERNLIAVLGRRLLFDARHDLAGGPFAGRAPADLASVLAFLAGETDDGRIAALAQGLAWAEPPSFISTTSREVLPMPLAYVMMKPFFAAQDDLDAIDPFPKGTRLPIPQGLVARLRAGQVGVAMELAWRRAQASGLPVAFKPGASQVAGTDGPRLLASLTIPIRKEDLQDVLERAYPALLKDSDNKKEEEPNAA